MAVFYERFLTVLKMLKMLKASDTKVDSNEKLAHLFATKLDPQRFGQWQIQLHNDAQVKRDNYPKAVFEA